MVCMGQVGSPDTSFWELLGPMTESISVQRRLLAGEGGKFPGSLKATDTEALI